MTGVVVFLVVGLVLAMFAADERWAATGRTMFVVACLAMMADTLYGKLDAICEAIPECAAPEGDTDGR